MILGHGVNYAFPVKSTIFFYCNLCVFFRTNRASFLNAIEVNVTSQSKHDLESQTNITANNAVPSMPRSGNIRYIEIDSPYSLLIILIHETSCWNHPHLLDLFVSEDMLNLQWNPGPILHFTTSWTRPASTCLSFELMVGPGLKSVSRRLIS